MMFSMRGYMDKDGMVQTKAAPDLTVTVKTARALKGVTYENKSIYGQPVDGNNVSKRALGSGCRTE
jgi:hypothetical protein